MENTYDNKYIEGIDNCKCFWVGFHLLEFELVEDYRIIGQIATDCNIFHEKDVCFPLKEHA